MWATRLWKRGEKGERFEGMCEDTGQATRLRKSGKKKDMQVHACTAWDHGLRVEGRVRVLGGLLG